MSSVAPNHLAIRKALNGDRKVYSVLRHPKLYLAADGKGGGSWRIKYQPRPGEGQRWVTISNDVRNADFQEVVKKANEMLSGLAVHGIDGSAPGRGVGASSWSER